MPQNSSYTLEICVETPEALAACTGVADRIELCSGLDVGGLTPSVGLMEQAKASGVETHVLIRPHCGDFTMTNADVTTAVADIRAVREIGLHGVVIGAERHGALDREALDAMVRAADGLDVTLHRVIDVVDDPIAALQVAVDYAMARILTSGAAISAPEGTAGLAKLHNDAAGRIEIMAGAGITSENVGAIITETDIKSVHASCSTKSPLDRRYAQFGFGKVARSFDPHEMKRLVKRLEAAPD